MLLFADVVHLEDLEKNRSVKNFRGQIGLFPHVRRLAWLKIVPIALALPRTLHDVCWQSAALCTVHHDPQGCGGSGGCHSCPRILS